MNRRWVIVLFSCLTLSAALAANWPQWRGPNLDGSTTAAHDLPVTWSEKDNVLWRVKLPSWSAATPIVWEQTIFITSAEPESPRLGERGTAKRIGPTGGADK